MKSVKTQSRALFLAPLALLIASLALTGCQEGQIVPIELYGKVSTPEGEATRGFQGALCAIPYFAGKPAPNANLKCAPVVANPNSEYQIAIQYEIQRLFQDGSLPDAVELSFHIPGVFSERLSFVETKDFKRDGKISLRYDFTNPYGYEWGQSDSFVAVLEKASQQERDVAGQSLYEYGLNFLDSMNPVELVTLVSNLEKMRFDPAETQDILVDYVRLMKRNGAIRQKEINLLTRMTKSAHIKNFIENTKANDTQSRALR